MVRRLRASVWTRSLERSVAAFNRTALKSGTAAFAKTLQSAQTSARAKRQPPRGAGEWPHVALGPGGARRYRLYCPPGVAYSERLPLVVMLHGCGQDAAGPTPRAWCGFSRRGSLAPE